MGLIQNILNSRLLKNGDFFIELQKTVGFSPRQLSYYYRAFTHKSSQKKDEFGNEMNFERLEFLGDAVLSTVIATYLFEELPEADEGNLTQMRSKIVSRNSLNALGKEFGLIRFLKSDVEQDQLGENIHGNLLEALVGAIYMDRGFKACSKFIHEKVLKNHVDIDQLEGKIISYKSYLLEWCQKEKKSFEFEDLEENSEEGNKYFVALLKISGQVVGKARSTSKKKAEEAAAKRAYFSLQQRISQ